MKIGILSDIHDHVWNLAAALPALSSCDALLCCGDLCSPFVIHQLGRGFPRPIHIVFGNNDADLYRITANARAYPHISLHGELYQGEFDGRRVIMNHFDFIARQFARSWDLICFGHNHTLEITRDASTLLVNPARSGAPPSSPTAPGAKSGPLPPSTTPKPTKPPPSTGPDA